MIAWVARMTGQPLSTLLDAELVDGPMFAALVDEAHAADNSSLHEILRVQCDLLYTLVTGKQDWRYPRPGDKPVERDAGVSPLVAARLIGGG